MSFGALCQEGPGRWSACTCTQAGLLAVPVAVAGFALAGTILASTLEPTTWTPVVDPAAASVTDVATGRLGRRVAPRGTYVLRVPAAPVGLMNRGLETTAAAVPPPRDPR